MAHFAEIDEHGFVLRVIVVSNNELLDIDGNEDEQLGISFCKTLYGQGTSWVQTSYNGNLRRRYAMVGGRYDVARDLFIDEKPFPSWSLDPETTEWTPPIPMPSDGGPYIWDESQLNWVSIPSASK